MKSSTDDKQVSLSPPMYVCMHIYTYIHVCAFAGLSMHTHVCTRVSCAPAYTNIYRNMYTCIYTFMHIHTHACIYAHISCVYIYTHPLNKSCFGDWLEPSQDLHSEVCKEGPEDEAISAGQGHQIQSPGTWAEQLHF